MLTCTEEYFFPHLPAFRLTSEFHAAGQIGLLHNDHHRASIAASEERLGVFL